MNRLLAFIAALLAAITVAGCTDAPTPLPGGSDSSVTATPTSPTPQPGPPDTVGPQPPTSTVVTPPPPPVNTGTSPTAPDGTPVQPTTVVPTPVPPPPAALGCVAPPGMKGLIDQDKSDEQLPWPRISDKTTVYFSTNATVTPTWLTWIQAGRDQWNRSPCLDVRVINTPCPASAYCVTVHVVQKGDDGNFDAVEKGGFTVGGDIQLLASLPTKDDGHGCNQQKNVAVHEMGHAIGEVHRKAHVVMNSETYADLCIVDDDEFRNIAFKYGNQPLPTVRRKAHAPGTH